MKEKERMTNQMKKLRRIKEERKINLKRIKEGKKEIDQGRKKRTLRS